MELGEALKIFWGGLLFVWTYIRSMYASVIDVQAGKGGASEWSKEDAFAYIIKLCHVRDYTYSMLRF